MRVAIRTMVVGGFVGLLSLAGCGDSSGSSDVTGGDTLQSDVVVPGPGECELSWVDGFSPFLGVQHRTWQFLDPTDSGTTRFFYGFEDGGPLDFGYADVKRCELVDGQLRFRASAEFDEATYAIDLNVRDFPGPGIWMVGAGDGLEVGFELGDPIVSVTFDAQSSASSMCEICVDATGRQGAFRCDELIDDENDLRGGLQWAGFICPESEPGFLP